MSDLDISRTFPQSVGLSLSIYKPNTMLACQVNNAAIAKGARTVAYDSVTSGSYTKIVGGMTLWVGTTPGAKDKGKIRVRSATASEITVAENSHIPWSDDLYLTVVDVMDVTSVFPRIAQDPRNPEVLYWYKDYDVAYTNQNSLLGSFICMGPHRAGKLDNDGELKFWYSASGTQHVNGESLTYAWEFPGADTITGSTAYEPGYITYKTPGHYMSKLTVTGINGSSDSSYRYVSIYPNTPDTQNWEIVEGQGSRSSNGFMSTILLRDAWEYDIYDGATVVIYSDDWYGGSHTSVGGNSKNNSSIYFVGYIMQGSIKWSYDRSTVEFQIASIDEVMKSTNGFAISLENCFGTPTTWYQISANNLKKSIYHFLRWHSTVLQVTDFHFVADDNYIQYYDTNRESLFDAVNSVLKSTLLAELVSDFQGALWLETSMEATHNAKTTYLPICTITKDDWIGEPTVQELFYDTVSYLEMGGIQFNPYLADNNSYPYLAAAPGATPGYHGKVESPSGLAVSSQAHLNQIIGDVFAYRNAKKPTINFELAGAYRIFDIAPQRAVQVLINAEDTSRNITINAPYFISGVRFNYNSKNQYLKTTITLREITEGFAGDSLIIPIDSPTPFPPIEIPPFPPLPPYIPPSPPYVPLGVLAIYINGKGIWFTNELALDKPNWYCSTPESEWTTEELSNVIFFDMNKFGRAFFARRIYVPLSHDTALYSQLIGQSGSKYLIADQDYFISQIGAGSFGGFPVITAIGVNADVDHSCAVYASMGYPDNRGKFFLATASTITPKLANPGIYELLGNFTHYNGAWYFSHGSTLAQTGFLYKLPETLTSIAGGLSIQGLFHIHAKDADFIYSSGTPTYSAKVVVDDSTSILRTFTATMPQNPQSVVCNPTGQYVFAFSTGTGLKKSSDYGATFTNVSLPHTVTGNIIRMVNLGDADTWVVVYNQSPSSTLEIMYTPDFGVTWIEKNGNLLDYVTPTSGVVGVRYA